MLKALTFDFLHEFSLFNFQVSITVVDVNDESPEFQFSVYKGQIDENLPQGSPVLVVKAIDGDDQNVVSMLS